MYLPVQTAWQVIPPEMALIVSSCVFHPFPRFTLTLCAFQTTEKVSLIVTHGLRRTNSSVCRLERHRGINPPEWNWHKIQDDRKSRPQLTHVTSIGWKGYSAYQSFHLTDYIKHIYVDYIYKLRTANLYQNKPVAPSYSTVCFAYITKMPFLCVHISCSCTKSFWFCSWSNSTND